MCEIESVDELHERISRDLEESPGEIERVIALFEEMVGPGKLVEPDDTDAWNTLKVALGKLLEQGQLHQASGLTVWYYHHICRKQEEAGRRFHKGSTAYQAGLISLQLRQPHEALWFVVLAFIEDILSNLETPENALSAPAARRLRTAFAVPLTALAEIAEAVRNAHEQDDSLSWYPEALAINLELQRLLPTPFAVGTNALPLNRHFLTLLHERLEEPGIPATAAGDRLEYLAAYLLKTLPGAHVVSKSRTPDHEIDLIITQRTPHNSYLLDVLGRAFIVECKNWNVPAGVEALNHFVSKMRFHKCTCGILFSKSGISGEGDAAALRFAQLTQLRWFHQDGCAVLAVSGDDIGSLLERSTSFGELLLDKYEHLRFRQMNAIQ